MTSDKATMLTLIPAGAPFPPLPRLDARLGGALPYIRGGVVADIGTDHAYLPIVLLTQKRCRFAVASDIHRGPAEIAARNLGRYGIGSDQAVVLLTDGLHGLSPYTPDDIILFGMGGEMIVHILTEGSDWIQKSSVRLIMQPMTHAEILREYLDRSGFTVIDQTLVRSDRVYQIICAEYDGIQRSHSPLEQYIGTHNLTRGGTMCRNLLNRLQRATIACRQGKQQAGLATQEQDLILNEIRQYFISHPEERSLDDYYT